MAGKVAYYVGLMVFAMFMYKLDIMVVFAFAVAAVVSLYIFEKGWFYEFR